jgi:parvulin-like peptidyl-prolyl isomerase/Tfp pilus assembly protein PilF
MIWIMIGAFAIGVLLLFTPSLSFNNPNANSSDTQQKTAITVDGAKITQGALDAADNQLLTQYRNFYQQFGQDFQKQLEGAQGAHYQLQLRYQAAQGLIDAQLTREQAQKRNLSISRVDLDKAFQSDYDDFLRNNKLTEPDFRKILQNATGQQRDFINQALGLQQGTLDEFKAKLRRQAENRLLHDKLQADVVGQLQPTDKELLDYLQAHKDQYIKKIVAPVAPTDDELKTYLKAHQDKYAPEEVKLSNILIKVAADATPADVQSASRAIQSVKAQLDKGADFAELAKKYSQDPSRDQGGDLGYLSRDKMDPKIVDVAFTLPVGKVSDVIRTDQGFGLIKVTDRRQKGFADVKDQLQTDYSNEIETQEFDRWQSQAQKAGVFPKTVEVHASHILIKVAKDAPADQVQTAYNKIAAIQKQLQAGADFAKLAQDQSEDPGTKGSGGDLGWFAHGVMDPAFDQAAYALQKEGDISPIVRSSFGYHLIKLLGRRETDAVKTEIQQAYIKDETQKRFDDWFKGMKSQAKIAYDGAPLLGAYDLENQISTATDDQTKRRYLDQVIQAYQKIQQDNSVTDTYVGYYISRLYAQKLKLDQAQRDGMAKQTGKDAERKALDQQIVLDRQQATQSFLSSADATNDAAAFDEALANDPQNAQLHYHYALLLLQQQDKEPDAVNQLKQALAADPTLTAAQLTMGDLQIKRYNYPQAIGYYATALKLAQGDANQTKQIQFKLGETYLAWSQLSSASGPDRENALKSAQDIFLKLQPTVSAQDQDQLYPRLLTDFGDLKMQQGDYPGAEDQYRQALQAGARQPVEIKLGQAYLADKKLDQAQQTFQSVINRDNYSADAYEGSGDVYHAQGQTDQALKQYREALKRNSIADGRIEISQKILGLDPKDKDTHLTLAGLYFDQHSYQGAEAEYKAVLQQDPNSIPAYKGLGDVYTARLDWSQAISNFKSALQLNPPIDEQITIYEDILNASQQRVGFGQKLDTDGQDALYQSASLYLKQANKTKAKEKLDQLQKDYPSYRVNDVAALSDQLSGKPKSATLASDGKPGQPVADQGSQLLPDCKLDYNSAPPTSGCHAPGAAAWGVSDKPISGELQVHNLAQGGVLLQYSPSASKDSIDQLTKLAQQLRQQPKYCKLIVAPYPGLDQAIALTAWDRIDKFGPYDEARIKSFIDTFINAQGPEKDSTCP